MRPFVTIENIKADIKRLKGLNPEVVVPAHGMPGTVQLLDETDRFYDVLLERVGKLAREGKSLDAIKTELRMPDYQSWSGGKERLDTNIEAAYRAVKSDGSFGPPCGYTGERRIICYGTLKGRLVVLGYTPRGSARHVFSMRKANDREKARLAPYFGV